MIETHNHKLVISIFKSLDSSRMIEIADLITEKADPESIFEVLDKLGQGSYGDVYKALHKETGELYAVKILPTTSGVQIQSIKNEIGVLKECRDDHIVRYFGSYYKKDELWIVMEYCVAGSVTDIMQITKKKFNENQIASVLESALKGLRYIHQNKKIHRDVKAANILLNNKGHAKLADFGVSASSMQTNARFKTHIGSPYWMSPEILKYSEYSHKTDIWSFGITAIELAEGQVPNAHIKPFMVIFMTKSNPVKGLSNPEHWTPEFNQFVKECLQINPQHRPQARQLLQHPFIKKYSMGERLLQELVLSSLQEIEQFRMNQSRNSSFAEIIVDVETNTVVQRRSEENNKQLGNGHSSQQMNEQNSMIVASSRHSECGSVIINNNSIAVDDNKAVEGTGNILSSYIDELKGMNKMEQKLRDKLISNINNYDRLCLEEIEEVFRKYKRKCEADLTTLYNTINQEYDKIFRHSISYSCKLAQSTDINEFMFGKPSKQEQGKSTKAAQAGIMPASIPQKGQQPQLPGYVHHNQSMGETRSIAFDFSGKPRKQSQSFKMQNGQIDMQKTNTNYSTNQFIKPPPSNNSSRILVKNGSRIPNVMSLIAKQQFRNDPDVFNYIKNVSNTTEAQNVDAQTDMFYHNNNFANATKMYTQVCIKPKHSENSISRGKNRSAKNLKPKKSKAKTRS